MLRLLKIKVSGYKQLANDFEINLVNKAKVNDYDLENEVIEVNKGLYCFRSLALVGANASGKSTILSLITNVCLLLQTGRWSYSDKDFKTNKLNLTVLFYLDGFIYEYTVILTKNKESHNNMIKYANIDSQSLYLYKYDKTKGKKNMLLFDSKKIDISNDLTIIGDTTSLVVLTKDEVIVDSFSNNNINGFTDVMVRSSFFDAINTPSLYKTITSIIQLLDGSIEYIKVLNNELYIFKRIYEDELILRKDELIGLLSSGTFRGVELFIRTFTALKYGKILVIDEIENSFQKNVVNNILMLFNNNTINNKGAQLIFSTHYTEILDTLERRDNIFITHQDKNYINISNLYEDYNVRTEKLKSRLFDNNIFDTALNYDKLMEVRENLINSLLE